MLAWARNIFSDEAFHDQTLYGFYATITTFAEDQVRDVNLKTLARLAKHLPTN